MKAMFRRRSAAGEHVMVTTATPTNSPNTPDIGQSDIAFNALTESLNLFLDNEFSASLAYCSEHETTSIYHSLSKAVLCFVNASIACHRIEMESGLRAAESCIKMCHTKCRRGSIFNSSLSHVLSKGGNFEGYTDLEIHKELISAESRLMIILLEVLRREQSTSAFLKRTSDHLRYCVSSFK